jgi:hypothetical protein
MIAQQETQTKPKYLRVNVVDTMKDGRPVVRVRVPIGLARFGLRMAQTFSPEMKGVNVDWDSIATMIEEGTTGELVHVEDEVEHKTVDVFVE